MLVRWHLLNILTSRSVTCVVVVIAIRLGDSMMRIGLVVLELIRVVLPKRRVEVLLLVWPGVMSVEAILRQF
jgi:hypothetical protein